MYLLGQKAPKLFFLYYFLAQREILNEHWRLALLYLDKALQLRPADGCTYNDKALCFAELGLYQQALEYFNIGIAKAPQRSVLYHNKGWLLNLLGRHKEAILCFRKALELDNLKPESWYSLADSYLCLGQRRHAFKYFKKALRLAKNRSFYVGRNIVKRLKNL